jgi:hypothetical protein
MKMAWDMTSQPLGLRPDISSHKDFRMHKTMANILHTFLSSPHHRLYFDQPPGGGGGRGGDGKPVPPLLVWSFVWVPYCSPFQTRILQ